MKFHFHILPYATDRHEGCCQTGWWTRQIRPRHASSARHAPLVTGMATRRLQAGSSCFRLRPWYVPVFSYFRGVCTPLTEVNSSGRLRLRSAQRGDLYVQAIPTLIRAVSELLRRKHRTLYRYISVHQPSAFRIGLKSHLLKCAYT